MEMRRARETILHVHVMKIHCTMCPLINECAIDGFQYAFSPMPKKSYCKDEHFCHGHNRKFIFVFVRIILKLTQLWTYLELNII